MRKLALFAVVAALGCASVSGGGGGAATPTPGAPVAIWPVLTRMHIDLWLHGYAMLLRDTATPPVFRRGYRDRMQSLKSQRGSRRNWMRTRNGFNRAWRSAPP
jgi:hypothetical protein